MLQNNFFLTFTKGKIYNRKAYAFSSQFNFGISKTSGHLIALKYNEPKGLMKQRIDMPDKLIDLFIRFTHQNNGIFPKMRRNIFQMLKDDEIEALQSIFQDVFTVEK